jgi:flagellar biosynthesis protein FlhB
VSDTSGDDSKTEQPTPRRLQKAREEGTVVRAHGLSSAAILIVGALVLMLGGGGVINLLEDSLRNGLRLDPGAMREPTQLLGAVAQILRPGIQIIAPFLLLMAAVGFLADTAVGGWVFSVRPLEPNFARLNPMKGLGQVLSRHGVVEVLKALAKFVVVGAVAIWLVESHLKSFVGLAAEAWPQAIRHVADLATLIFLVLSGSLACVVALEVPYQLWSHRDRLKMTRQEVKDEMHEQEGSPHTKRRIKNMRRKLARGRMMSQVPKANAVVVNPQHYAAALRYDENRMRAPRLVAKGTGLTALRIREIAGEHSIPVIEAPPLARSICHFVDLEDEIPVGLYQAVAEVLAYVYRLRLARDAGKPLPALPQDGRFDPPREFDA